MADKPMGEPYTRQAQELWVLSRRRLQFLAQVLFRGRDFLARRLDCLFGPVGA